MADDLEQERLKAEIAKLKAEVDHLGKPPNLLSQYGPLVIGVIGALGGLAALLNVWVQIANLKYTQSGELLSAREEAIRVLKLKDDATMAVATLAKQREDLLQQLGELKPKYAEATTARAALQDQAAKNSAPSSTTSTTTDTLPRTTVQIFVRNDRQLATINSGCVTKLKSAGYVVSGVQSVANGPSNDEVKYFWEADAKQALALRNLMNSCGLQVPMTNVVWITGDPGSANSPRDFFEVWGGRDGA